MKNIFCLGLLGFVITTSACNDNRKAKNYNEKTLVDDQGLAFIKQAKEAGLTEIKAANVAKIKSANPRVISFAEMMLTEHTTGTNELQAIADRKYVNISNVISTEHQAKLDSIGKLSGADFDKAYMQMMVADHGKVVELFHNANQNTSSTLRKYTEKYLPKLMMHLDSAKAISAALK